MGQIRINVPINRHTCKGGYHYSYIEATRSQLTSTKHQTKPLNIRLVQLQIMLPIKIKKASRGMIKN